MAGDAEESKAEGKADRILDLPRRTVGNIKETDILGFISPGAPFYKIGGDRNSGPSNL